MNKTQVPSMHPSLCPPAHGYPPDANADDSSPGWVILDMHAYIADRENATSAYGELSNGEAIRVTFCTAPPPLVSYVCIWCPNLPPTALDMQPTVEAAEADLVLFRLALANDRYNNQYFVYKAPGCGKGPSLWRLERPHQISLPYRHNIALLAHREVSEGGHIRPHVDDNGHYYMATLNRNPDTPQNFNLLLYNSMHNKWSSTPIPLDMTQIHIPGKAITLGEGGLLGFVDPWRGILVCDILGRKRPHFLPLPAQLVRFDKLHGQPWLFRNIAFVNGRLTVVEQHRNPAYPRKSLNQEFTTWSISSPWEAPDGWQMDYRMNTSCIIVDDATANVDLLLCKLQENVKLRQENVTPQPTLDRLIILHPTLSLSESHIVYLMAKVSLRDDKPLVLSVDMRYPRLQGVAVFDAERMTGYTYMQARVSNFFNMVPGLKGSLKRPGKFHMRYPHKHRSTTDDDDGPMLLPGGATAHTREDTMIADDDMAVD
nr:unnamed protein product [Digitaria exilis]